MADQLIRLYAKMEMGTSKLAATRLPAKSGLDAMPMMISTEMSQMMIHSRRVELLSATWWKGQRRNDNDKPG
jgi:hypothetical protein